MFNVRIYMRNIYLIMKLDKLKQKHAKTSSMYNCNCFGIRQVGINYKMKSSVATH